jgi:hypothetical protein
MASLRSIVTKVANLFHPTNEKVVDVLWHGCEVRVLLHEQSRVRSKPKPASERVGAFD